MADAAAHVTHEVVSSEEEPLILVDEADREIGHLSKGACHDGDGVLCGAGREVRLEITVDETLIGGAVAKVGDLVFDGSIRTQLEQLQASLTKGS